MKSSGYYLNVPPLLSKRKTSIHPQRGSRESTAEMSGRRKQAIGSLRICPHALREHMEVHHHQDIDFADKPEGWNGRTGTCTIVILAILRAERDRDKKTVSISVFVAVLLSLKLYETYLTIRRTVRDYFEMKGLLRPNHRRSRIP